MTQIKQLREKAVLVSLNISQWAGRKFDRTATDAVNKEFKSSNAGRFNKMLIDKSILSPMSKIASEMRNYHLEHTLPWTDGGERILPATLLVKYKARMAELKGEFEAELDTFCDKYDAEVTKAEVRLKTLFVSSDYPSCEDIKDKFKSRISFAPMPDTDDFRIDSSIDLGAFKAEIEDTMNQRHVEAIKDITSRAKKKVTALVQAVNRMDNKKSRFSGSLINNINDLVHLIPAMNYTNDPEITKLGEALQELCKYDASVVKEDTLVQDTIKQRAKELSDRFF